jgi:hypothetical protein
MLGFNEDLPAPRPATLASSPPSKPGRPLSKNVDKKLSLFTRKARKRKKGVNHVYSFDSLGAPGMIRTCDLLIRSQALYPTELRARREVGFYGDEARSSSSFFHNLESFFLRPGIPAVPAIPGPCLDKGRGVPKL